MICVGHRGAMGHAPENTLLSVQTALEMGVDWIEIDVYVVAGELVVIHDDFVDRTTNGTGAVMAQSLADLRALDAGQGQRVPLLQEVFDLVDRRVGINVELKGPETAVPLHHFWQRQLAAGWTYDQLVVSSFDHDQLRTARQLDGRLPIGALTFQTPPSLAAIQADLSPVSWNPWLGNVTAVQVDEAHALGMQVWVYTVNEPDDIARMRAWGVDAVFTNYPDRMNG